MPRGEIIDRFFSGFEVEMIGGNVRIVPYGVHATDGEQIAETAEFALIVPISACGTLVSTLLSILGHPIFVDAAGKIVMLQ